MVPKSFQCTFSLTPSSKTISIPYLTSLVSENANIAISVSDQEVFRFIKSWDSTKATGSYKKNYRNFRNLSPELSVIFVKLFPNS